MNNSHHGLSGALVKYIESMIIVQVYMAFGTVSKKEVLDFKLLYG